jgi:hypothetical protein
MMMGMGVDRTLSSIMVSPALWPGLVSCKWGRRGCGRRPLLSSLSKVLPLLMVAMMIYRPGKSCRWNCKVVSWKEASQVLRGFIIPVCWGPEAGVDVVVREAVVVEPTCMELPSATRRIVVEFMMSPGCRAMSLASKVDCQGNLLYRRRQSNSVGTLITPKG